MGGGSSGLPIIGVGYTRLVVSGGTTCWYGGGRSSGRSLARVGLVPEYFHKHRRGRGVGTKCTWAFV